MKTAQITKMLATLQAWYEHEEGMATCGRDAREDVANERLSALDDAIAALEALGDVE